MKNIKKKGFTLLELIVVIAIIGILAAIAIPNYQKSRNQAAITADQANIQMLKTAGSAASADNITGTFDKTKPLTEYVDKWPEVPALVGKDQMYQLIINNNGTTEVKHVTDTTPVNPGK